MDEDYAEHEDPAGSDSEDSASSCKVEEGGRSHIEMHMEVVDFIKSLARDVRVDAGEIKRCTGVDLNFELSVLDMLKTNPKVDLEIDEYGELSFQYRAKYDARSEADLLALVSRVKTGVVMKELVDSSRPLYPSIEEDCYRLIVGGGVVACKNPDVKVKSYVLFPRHKPFLTKLSGTVDAQEGSQYIATSESLLADLRRGDALRVGDSWFRVSSSVSKEGSGGPQRSKAPLSVSSDKDLSDRNIYYHAFGDSSLPLDGAYDGPAFVGRAVRHGVSNDIRQCWADTLTELRVKINGEEHLLNQELLRMRLVRQVGSLGAPRKRSASSRDKKDAKRARRAPRAGVLLNSHLAGSELDRRATELSNAIGGN